MTIEYPGYKGQNHLVLPLFRWAMQYSKDRSKTILQFSIRYHLTPLRARLIAELMNIGGKDEGI